MRKIVMLADGLSKVDFQNTFFPNYKEEINV
jgi:hypothetical protein